MRALFDNNAADAAGWLPKVDARAKLALSVVAAIGSLVVSNIQGQLLLCGFSMCYALALRKPKALLWAYLFFTLMCGMAMGCMWIMGQFMPSLNKAGFTGLVVPFLRMLTMLHVVLPMALSTRVQDLLNALRGMRLPFCIYLPAAVVVRFIPTFLADVQQVTESLRLRGYRLSPWGITRHPVQSMRLLFTPLLFRSLRTSEDLGIAAELKGLGYGKTMTPYKTCHWALRDTLLLIAACAALGTALALQIHLGGTSLGGMR